jgi:hypothetical protein
LSVDDIEQISALDTRESLFLSYHDPERYISLSPDIYFA